MISITSDARRCRMTRLTCSMSSAIGASKAAALGEEVAVDDMIGKLGNAADYKANPTGHGRRERRTVARTGAIAGDRARAACGWPPPDACRVHAANVNAF
nr:hypothetical protein [Caballeronia sp. ATUFL_M2_KS44]